MAKSAGGGRHLQASAAGMVIIRLFLGAFFLYCGIDQLLHVKAFAAYLDQLALPPSISAIPGLWAYYAGFLRAPLTAGGANTVAWGIIALELLVGALLLVGCCTRLAVAIPLAANLVFLYLTLPLLRNEMLHHGLWVNAGFFLMEFAVLIAAAGRTLGVDARLAARTRVKLFW